MKAKIVPTSPKERLPADHAAEVEAFMHDTTVIAKPTVVRFSISLVVVVVLLSFLAGLVGSAVFTYGKDQWPWLAQWFGTQGTDTNVIRTPTKNSTSTVSSAEVVRDVGQSVVSIFVRRAPAKNADTLNQLYIPDDFRGAGVILTEDGIGVTMRQTIPDLTKEIAVVTSDRTVYLTKDFSIDPASDLVYFRVSGKGFPVVDFSELGSLLVTQPTVTVSLDPATLGFVATASSITATQSYRIAARADVLRSTERLSQLVRIARATSVAAEPVFTLEGKFVGLQTGNSGDVLPVDVIASGLQRLQRDGGVSRNVLGLHYVNLPVAKGLLLAPLPAGTQGAFVLGDAARPAVVAGSPADRAGIRAGDVVIRVDDRSVSESPSLSQLIQEFSARATITLTITRDGTEQRLPVTLDTATP